ncbi:unnamed protein product [Prunus brigantina]
MRKADPKTVTQVNGIKFIVGNKLIQFTTQHFCLITGLRFRKLPFIPKAKNENCSLKRKYFSSNKPTTLLDIHTAFIECTDDEDALKLGMLAEDLEEFDKYPWGAVSYVMTNASLLRAVSVDYQRVKVPQNRKKPNKSGKRAQTRMESDVFQLEVDVQLVRPTDIEKQQPYWSWGDDENNEEIVQLFGDVEETAALPSSSKGKESFNDFGSLKHQLESTKDKLAKLRSSNCGLRNRVRDLEAIVEKNCLKHEKECDRNKKAIRNLTLTIASVEHYFKLEMEELKKIYGGEGHEEWPKMDAQVPGDGMEAFPGMHTERAEMEATVCGGVEAFPAMHIEGAEREVEFLADGVEAFPAMEVEDAKIDTSVGDKQVHQQPHKVPTSEDVKVPSLEDPLLPTPEDRDGYRVIFKTMLHLLEDWNKTEIQGVGRKARPPMKTSITLVDDEGDKEANATVQKPDAEGKGCRLKRPATTLLSPFTDPSRKKRPTTGFHAQTPEARFDPTKPVAMDDVKAIIQVCNAWKSDISAELELEPFVGADFFYKLLDETAWMSSRQFLQPFTPPIAKRVTRKQISLRTVDPPPNYLRNIHHFVYGSWQHGYAQAWTKVRKVYLSYNVRQSHWVAVEIDFVRHTLPLSMTRILVLPPTLCLSDIWSLLPIRLQRCCMK